MPQMLDLCECGGRPPCGEPGCETRPEAHPETPNVTPWDFSEFDEPIVCSPDCESPELCDACQ